MRVLNIIKYSLFTWAVAQLVAIMFICSVAIFMNYWIIDITEPKLILAVVTSVTLIAIIMVLQIFTKLDKL